MKLTDGSWSRFPRFGAFEVVCESVRVYVCRHAQASKRERESAHESEREKRESARESMIMIMC